MRMMKSLQSRSVKVAVGLALALTAADFAGSKLFRPLQAATAPDTVESLMQRANEDWIRDHPDEFSWRILAAISRPVTQANSGGTPPDCWKQPGEYNYAEWETWADDDFLFPGTPKPDSPPAWGARHCVKDDLIPDPLSINATWVEPLAGKMLFRGPLPPVPPPGPKNGVEEIRHNQYDLQLIVDTRMWYLEGLSAAFHSGFDGDHVPKILADHAAHHPEDRYAVEIKAEWMKISENDKSDYHWNWSYGQGGTKTLWGLVALHIMTRGLNTWTWSTFENVHTPPNTTLGQCDAYGCKDTYGCIDQPNTSFCPTYIPPNPQPGHEYKPLQRSLSSNVRQLLESYGEWMDWQNYRLKGTQIAYLDDQGQPTHLGNSKLEAQVESKPTPTSSCISCHAAARAHESGVVACDWGFLKNEPHGIHNLNESPYGLPTEYDSQSGLDHGMGPMGFIWSVVNAHDTHGQGSCKLPLPIQ